MVIQYEIEEPIPWSIGLRAWRTKTMVIQYEIEEPRPWSIGLEQGFSNIFSEGPDEIPMQPERARTVFFFGGGAEYVREADITSAKSLAAGVQGPLKGPGSSGVIDALWCNLSLILDHLQFGWNLFYYTECNQIEACFILSHTND